MVSSEIPLGNTDMKNSQVVKITISHRKNIQLVKKFANQLGFTPKEIDIKHKAIEAAKNIKKEVKTQKLNQFKTLKTQFPVDPFSHAYMEDTHNELEILI